MSGHSKWSNIKHRKGAQDAKRGKQFTKIIREITMAIKENGLNPDPESNPTLRNAIQNARGLNMPKDTIQRAIKKATGDDGKSYQKMTFEGYGPYGIAVFLECSSDNLNRTVSDVRAIFTKFGGDLGKNGSVDFLFERLGVFTIEKEKLTIDKEELQLELIEDGAKTFEEEEDVFIIYSNFNDFGNVSHRLDELAVEVKNADLQRIPLSTDELPVSQSKTILKMMDAFEDNDDVQHVFHTMELTDELMEALNAE